jgi:hypothetical protein
MGDDPHWRDRVRHIGQLCYVYAEWRRFGAATITSHTSGCGNLMRSGQAFAVSILNPNGSGTANLSCGPGCEWNFDIQVSPDRSMFNVVDVSPANPGNFVEGVAIRQHFQ